MCEQRISASPEREFTYAFTVIFLMNVPTFDFYLTHSESVFLIPKTLH